MYGARMTFASRLTLAAGTVSGLIVIGCVSVSPAPSPSSVTPPAVASVAPTAALGTSPTTRPAPAVWRRIPFGAGNVGAVTAFGGGFVAVGGSERGAAVWTSADGSRWDRVLDQPAFQCGSTDPAEGCLMKAVAARTGDLVAVGVGPGPGGGGGRTWHSKDGRTWQLNPQHPDLVGTEFQALIAGGPGFVAVDGRRVWATRDGVTWMVTASSFPEGAWLQAITTRASDVVIVGSISDPSAGSNKRRPAAWSSADGSTWRASAPIAEEDDSYMNLVASGAEGLAAFGYRGTSAAVWISRDAIVWSPTPDMPAFDQQLAAGNQVQMSATSFGFVIVGASAQPGPPPLVCSSPTVWISGDGRTWTKHQLEPACSGIVGGVAEGADGLVLVGFVSEPAQRGPAVWISGR